MQRDVAQLLCAYHLSRRGRKWWVRPMLAERNEDGNRLFADIAEEAADEAIRGFLRMTEADFEWLLEKITPAIQRQDTNMRKAVAARERLIITLRFLATGDSYHSLQYCFRVSVSLISQIIPEVCDCLVEVLQDYIRIPSTQEEWLQVSNEFERKWRFPHVIGAIDGKHVRIKKPKDSGSDYFNYKSFFSIVLLAIVDANFNFMYVDVGGKGGISDGGIFRHSSIFGKLQNKTLNVPAPSIIREPYQTNVPYMLVGDKAFAFTEFCIRPFGKEGRVGSIERTFNDIHSSARRSVEIAFGILSNKFRVLHTPIYLEPEAATKVVLAAVYLHNFIRKRNPGGNNQNLSLGSAATASSIFTNLETVYLNSARASQRLMNIRNHLAHYFLHNNITPRAT